MIFLMKLKSYWKHKSFLFFLLLFPVWGFTQELNCKIVINAQQIQTQETRIFQDMERAFKEFLNNKKWTQDEFEDKERIDCNLIITLNSMPSIGNFTATVQIQSARPIYNSNYNSLVLNYADRNWSFEYLESQPMDFNENSFLYDITSLLAYYAYLIIGIDYDTFSETGGTPYFQKAQKIVQNAAASGREGSWSQFGGERNRYWLIENILSLQMEPIRKGWYTYHRLAMDIFQEAPDASRVKILEVLNVLKKVSIIRPNSILLIAFLDAKSDELINIFKEGDPNLKKQAYNVLSVIDPSKTSNYEVILE